ncbi:MAG: hypothetical protein WKG06_33715 [Segetibacter sp.]
MKYQFYPGIGKSEEKIQYLPKLLNDCIQLYPSFPYKDYNVYIQEDSNQYIRGFLKRSFDLIVSSAALITGFPFLHFWLL